MSQLNEIKLKIGSIGKTRAITEAMQRIASVKVGYARRRAEAVRPYTQALLDILQRLVAVRPEYAPALMREKKGGSGGVGLFVVTTDKGLCGALNVRLLQVCVRQMQVWQEEGRQVFATAVGNRGLGVLRGAGAHIVAEAAGISGDVLESEELFGAVAVALQQFLDGEVDQLWVATNRFVNALAYEPTLERLLPVEAELLERISAGDDIPSPTDNVDYLYEPDPEHSINLLLMRYVESMMYSAVANNVACEHSARMMAMKAASDNASRLIDLLTHTYHKTRQEAITRELIELTAGADALAEG